MLAYWGGDAQKVINAQVAIKILKNYHFSPCLGHFLTKKAFPVSVEMLAGIIFLTLKLVHEKFCQADFCFVSRETFPHYLHIVRQLKKYAFCRDLYMSNYKK